MSRSKEKKESRQLAYIYLREMHAVVNSGRLPDDWQNWGVLKVNRFKYVISRARHLGTLTLPRSQDIFDVFYEFACFFAVLMSR